MNSSSATEQDSPSITLEPEPEQVNKGLQVLLKEKLTIREQEIVFLILEGNTNQYIYEQLCISKNTLKTHFRSIFRKLGVSNKHELLALALDLRNMEAEKQHFVSFSD